MTKLTNKTFVIFINKCIRTKLRALNKIFSSKKLTVKTAAVVTRFVYHNLYCQLKVKIKKVVILMSSVHSLKKYQLKNHPE